MDYNEKILAYFKQFIDLVEEPEKTKLIAFYKTLPEEFYDYPAVSSENQSKIHLIHHGLMYAIYDGLIALKQFIRARSDIMQKYKDNADYKGTTPESDLICAFLLHDCLKYKKNPSGINVFHDKDCANLCDQLGFNEVICELVRCGHGQWSSSLSKEHPFVDIANKKYVDLIWLLHYADMIAAANESLPLLEAPEPFDRSIFSKNRQAKFTDNTIDTVWWVKEEVNDQQGS